MFAEDVAANPSPPVALLKELAKHGEDTGIVKKKHAANNPNTPAAVLEDAGAGQGGMMFARKVAANPNTPAAVLEALAKDQDARGSQKWVASKPQHPCSSRWRSC